MSESHDLDLRSKILGTISRLWWLMLLRGVLAIVLGLYALLQPGMTLAAFAVVLGAFVLVDGLFALATGLLGDTDSEAWTIARGVLGILVGVFVLAYPALVGAIAAAVLMIVIGIQILASGILEIYVAIQTRKEIEGEGWLILAGVLSVIFGGILVFAPLLSSLLFIRILGAFAIVFGISLVTTSLRMRKLESRETAP